MAVLIDTKRTRRRRKPQAQDGPPSRQQQAPNEHQTTTTTTRQQEARLRLAPGAEHRTQPAPTQVRLAGPAPGPNPNSSMRAPTGRPSTSHHHSVSISISSAITASGRRRAPCTGAGTPTTGLRRLSLVPFSFITIAAAVSLLNLSLITIQPTHSAAANNIVVGQQQSQAASAPSSPPAQQHSSSVIQLPTSATTATQAKARYKTMYACEDRQLTMDCDFGSKINLIRANFGRFSITQCNEQGQLDLSTDCMSPITFRIMQERCQDKQKCSVNATSLIFGDRCPKTRKYLEVHFQCQPDPRATSLQTADVPERVDLRNSSQLLAVPTAQPVPPPTFSGGSSPILPPNNPSSGQYPPTAPRQPSIAPSSFQESAPVSGPASGASLAPAPTPGITMSQQQQPKPVINSEIMSYNLADNYNDMNNFQDPNNREPILVTMRHSHIDNMSNPRCFLWDQAAKQWTQQGSHIMETNLTHTICAFDQATSYLLVMDYFGPISTVSKRIVYLFARNKHG